MALEKESIRALIKLYQFSPELSKQKIVWKEETPWTVETEKSEGGHTHGTPSAMSSAIQGVNSTYQLYNELSNFTL